MADEIIIVDYNPLWSEMAQQEKERLMAKFGSQIIAIEHIGSTAVPGLSAKPVIDLFAGVKSMDIADTLLDPLHQLGYESPPPFNSSALNKTFEDRRFLRRLNEYGVRTHHLHLVLYQGDHWVKTLKFRDQLRAYPELAAEYASLKKELAERFRNNREAYVDAKTAFVQRVLQQA
jgi:GrpB-like predicted nucleotidyltransferase (UPF0157 family)